MINSEKYPYISKNNFDVIELPYHIVPLSMFIILPKKRDGIEALEGALTGDQLISLFGQVETRPVDLQLPKFTIRQSIELKTVLQQLGLQKMFTDGADFAPIATNLKVSDAVHESYIKASF